MSDAVYWAKNPDWLGRRSPGKQSTVILLSRYRIKSPLSSQYYTHRLLWLSALTIETSRGQLAQSPTSGLCTEIQRLWRAQL